MIIGTVIPSHYMFQRQVEATLEMKEKIPFSRGLLASLVKQTTKSFLLYSFYYSYNRQMAKWDIEGESEKLQRNIHSNVMKTRI